MAAPSASACRSLVIRRKTDDNDYSADIDEWFRTRGLRPHGLPMMAPGKEPLKWMDRISFLSMARGPMARAGVLLSSGNESCLLRTRLEAL